MIEKVVLTKNNSPVIAAYNLRTPGVLTVGRHTATILEDSEGICLDFGVLYPAEAREILDAFGVANSSLVEPTRIKIRPTNVESLKGLLVEAKKISGISTAIATLAFFQLTVLLLQPVANGVMFFMSLFGKLGRPTVPPFTAEYFWFWIAVLLFTTIPVLPAASYLYEKFNGVFLERLHAKYSARFETLQS